MHGFLSQLHSRKRTQLTLEKHIHLQPQRKDLGLLGLGVSAQADSEMYCPAGRTDPGVTLEHIATVQRFTTTLH